MPISGGGSLPAVSSAVAFPGSGESAALASDAPLGAAAGVSVGHGSGRVVLLGFRAQHRAQTHGTFKLLFNALVSTP